MPGFLNVRPQDWATPQPSTVVGGPLIFGVDDNASGDTAGLHRRTTDGVWSRPSSGIASTDGVKRVCGCPDSGTRCYAVINFPSLKFLTSDDAGDTWTEMSWPSGADGTERSSYSHQISSPAAGTVYMAVGGSSSGRGIWKTTDHGATWSRIVTFPAGTIRAGRVAATATRLWYSRFVEGDPAGVVCFYSALDGTGEAAIPSVSAGLFNPSVNMIPISDSFAVMYEQSGGPMWTWAFGAGSATVVTPVIGGVMSAIAITDSVFIAMCYDDLPYGIFRTDDAGANWTKVQATTTPDEDWSGTDDNGGQKLDFVKTDTNKVMAFGSRNRDSGDPDFNPNSQFFVLLSGDQGVTWTVEDVSSAVPADLGVRDPINFVWELAALG